MPDFQVSACSTNKNSFDACSHVDAPKDVVEEKEVPQPVPDWVTRAAPMLPPVSAGAGPAEEEGASAISPVYLGL